MDRKLEQLIRDVEQHPRAAARQIQALEAELSRCKVRCANLVGRLESINLITTEILRVVNR